tara:strand:- start:10181 stop:11434 length:1254 start_codon:yes stop_codon:yes gene_type:complete
MKLLGLNFNFPFFTRNKSGDTFYDLTSLGEWTESTSNMSLGLSHPILSPALLFKAKLFSQAKLDIVRSSTGKKADNHPYKKLFNKPNYNQTISDLLESLLFTQMCNGVGVIWKKKSFGTSRANSFYCLDFDLIEFPEEIEKLKYPNQSVSSRNTNMKVRYDVGGEDLSIPIDDLMFFYDMPNGVDPKNPYNSSSRLDAIKQTLFNSKDSEIAKSIIIKSNGKELISGEKQGFPLVGDEKEKVENSYNQRSLTRRGIVTNASLKWQSLHIIMRDLGHDEGIKTDASVIFAALHLPSDVYSIAGAKSTYKNANQSLVSYIQNEMMSTIESFVATINASLFADDNYELVGSYDHLPVMLAFSTINIENAKKQGEALQSLRSAGVPDELALELCQLPANTQLKPLSIETQNDSTNENQGDE